MRADLGSIFSGVCLCTTLSLVGACADAQPSRAGTRAAATASVPARAPTSEPATSEPATSEPATSGAVPLAPDTTTTGLATSGTAQPGVAASDAQAIITTVVPDGSVMLRRVGTPRPVTARTGMAMRPGDQLTSTDPRALFELRCAKQPTTLYRLERAFRLLIAPPVENVCHINVISGRGTIIAETPTHTTAGPVGMTSRGTQYSVDVTGEEPAVRCELSVFEGTVLLPSGGEPVLQGRSAVWAPSVKSRGVLDSAAIERSAILNARFDVMAARARSPGIDTAATFKEMKRLQYESLANPTDRAKRVTLAKRQLDLKVVEQAAYNLKGARVTSDSALRQNDINPAIIRANPMLRERVLTTPPPAARRSGAATQLAPMVRRVDTMPQPHAARR